LGATARVETVPTVSGASRIRHTPANDDGWQPLLSDPDLLEQGVATLPWKET
jgi:hypothetical protein